MSYGVLWSFEYAVEILVGLLNGLGGSRMIKTKNRPYRIQLASAFPGAKEYPSLCGGMSAFFSRKVNGETPPQLIVNMDLVGE